MASHGTSGRRMTSAEAQALGRQIAQGGGIANFIAPMAVMSAPQMAVTKAMTGRAMRPGVTGFLKDMLSDPFLWLGLGGGVLGMAGKFARGSARRAAEQAIDAAAARSAGAQAIDSPLRAAAVESALGDVLRSAARGEELQPGMAGRLAAAQIAGEAVPDEVIRGTIRSPSPGPSGFPSHSSEFIDLMRNSGPANIDARPSGPELTVYPSSMDEAFAEGAGSLQEAAEYARRSLPYSHTVSIDPGSELPMSEPVMRELIAPVSFSGGQAAKTLSQTKYGPMKAVSQALPGMRYDPKIAGRVNVGPGGELFQPRFDDGDLVGFLRSAYDAPQLGVHSYDAPVGEAADLLGVFRGRGIDPSVPPRPVPPPEPAIEDFSHMFGAVDTTGVQPGAVSPATGEVAEQAASMADMIRAQADARIPTKEPTRKPLPAGAAPDASSGEAKKALTTEEMKRLLEQYNAEQEAAALIGDATPKEPTVGDIATDVPQAVTQGHAGPVSFRDMVPEMNRPNPRNPHEFSRGQKGGIGLTDSLRSFDQPSMEVAYGPLGRPVIAGATYPEIVSVPGGMSVTPQQVKNVGVSTAERKVTLARQLRELDSTLEYLPDGSALRRAAEAERSHLLGQQKAIDAAMDAQEKQVFSPVDLAENVASSPDAQLVARELSRNKRRAELARAVNMLENLQREGATPKQIAVAEKLVGDAAAALGPEYRAMVESAELPVSLQSIIEGQYMFGKAGGESAPPLTSPLTITGDAADQIVRDVVESEGMLPAYASDVADILRKYRSGEILDASDVARVKEVIDMAESAGEAKHRVLSDKLKTLLPSMKRRVRDDGPDILRAIQDAEEERAMKLADRATKDEDLKEFLKATDDPDKRLVDLKSDEGSIVEGIDVTGGRGPVDSGTVERVRTAIRDVTGKMPQSGVKHEIEDVRVAFPDVTPISGGIPGGGLKVSVARNGDIAISFGGSREAAFKPFDEQAVSMAEQAFGDLGQALPQESVIIIPKSGVPGFSKDRMKRLLSAVTEVSDADMIYSHASVGSGQRAEAPEQVEAALIRIYGPQAYYKKKKQVLETITSAIDSMSKNKKAASYMDRKLGRLRDEITKIESFLKRERGQRQLIKEEVVHPLYVSSTDTKWVDVGPKAASMVRVGETPGDVVDRLMKTAATKDSGARVNRDNMQSLLDWLSQFPMNRKTISTLQKIAKRTKTNFQYRGGMPVDVETSILKYGRPGVGVPRGGGSLAASLRAVADTQHAPESVGQILRAFDVMSQPEFEILESTQPKLVAFLRQAGEDAKLVKRIDDAGGMESLSSKIREAKQAVDSATDASARSRAQEAYSQLQDQAERYKNFTEKAVRYFDAADQRVREVLTDDVGTIDITPGGAVKKTQGERLENKTVGDAIREAREAAPKTPTSVAKQQVLRAARDAVKDKRLPKQLVTESIPVQGAREAIKTAKSAATKKAIAKASMRTDEVVYLPLARDVTHAIPRDAPMQWMEDVRASVQDALGPGWRVFIDNTGPTNAAVRRSLAAVAKEDTALAALADLGDDVIDTVVLPALREARRKGGEKRRQILSSVAKDLLSIAAEQGGPPPSSKGVEKLMILLGATSVGVSAFRNFQKKR